MKCALVLFAVVGFASAASFETYGLKQDIDKLRGMIPVDKIKAIIKKYEDAGDKDVLELGEYVRSDKFKTLAKKVWAIPGVKEGVADLEAQGLNVKGLVRDIATAIGIPLHMSVNYESVTYGWREMAKEIKAVIPTADILTEAVELLQTSKDFQDMYKKIASQETREILRQIVAFPETKELVMKLRERGLDVDKVVKTVKEILGWN